MRTFIIALAASTALAGAAYAQSASPTAPDQEQDSTVVPPDGGTSATDAAPASDAPTAPDQIQDETVMDAEEAAPQPGASDAPAVPGEAPTAPDQEQDDTEEQVEVGGAPMFADQPISVNAPTASNLTTLWAAVQAAGLEETLAGEGPFTVFAPDNAAFEALPAGTVDTLLEPENRDQLTTVLTYHVVPSVLTSADLAEGSSQELTTVQGGTLTIASAGGTVTVTDEEGNTATVTQADVLQSNGIVHVIDTVLMPAE